MPDSLTAKQVDDLLKQLHDDLVAGNDVDSLSRHFRVEWEESGGRKISTIISVSEDTIQNWLDWREDWLIEAKVLGTKEILMIRLSQVKEKYYFYQTTE